MATNYKGWTKQAEWHGNPELGFDSWMKLFKTPQGRKVPVYVFGKDRDFSFCVSAGANSDYSYSGCFYPEKPEVFEFMDKVDNLDKDKKLIY